MKKKLSSKKCIALILAVVMIITSVPLMMVGAVTIGAYDPAPYWGDDPTDKYGAINTNFVATLNTDGSVDISFPNANAQKTYNGSADKTIDKYVFTLTKLQDDGTRKEIYSEVFTAAQVATGTEGAKYPNNIYYGPGGLESLPDYDVKATYDVAIMAIDSDGWFSDKIHTLLTDTPYYEISADFSPNEMWISRTLLDFEAAGTAGFYGGSQSSNGAAGSMWSEVNSGQSEIDYIYNVNGLLKVDGQMSEMGYNGSSAYRFWIENAYTDTSFTYDATWSRQHYDFSLTGVDSYDDAEVWFYVDFSRVDVNKMAFHLRANEKEVTTWRTGKIEKSMSQYGTLFSTKAVNGVNTGVQDGIYLQNAEGLWEETTMTDGYVTGLAGYKGFIRIPIEYFVLQENQYITTDNIREKEWAQTGSYLLGSFTTPSDFTNYRNSHMFLTSAGDWSVSVDGVACPSETVSMTFVNNQATDEQETLEVERFLVNSAGTPVTESFIIYNRYERVSARDSGWSTNSTYNWQFGNTLAYDANTTDETDASVFSTTAMTKNGTSYNIDSSAAAKAISDIASAGFEIAEWTNESVHKSFYLDQVLICQKLDDDGQNGIVYDTDTSSSTYGMVSDSSTVKFAGESSFAGDYGYVVKSYYDRTIEVPKVVANYITEYVGKTPSLDDVNTLEMINEIILTYRECFPTVSSTDNDVTTLEKAVTYLNTLGYTDAYNRYVAAKTFIETYINLGDSARNYNAVIAFESGVELLPEPEFADYNDEELKAELEQLMALYKSFNLSHFEILGAEAENKFTELYSIMMGEEVKTGYSIGAYPYIPFNDFENNYTLGQLSEFYYDDYPLRTSVDTKAQDINNTHNFVTFVDTDYVNAASLLSSSIGWHVQTYSPTAKTAGLLGISQDAIFENDDYFARMDAIISNQGFVDSLGATIRINGDLNASSGTVPFATLSTTYLGAQADTWASLPGLNLSALAVATDTANGTDAEDVTRYGTGVIPNSFVMYVDFSEINTQVDFTIKFILDNGSGEDFQAYFCGGPAYVDPEADPLVANEIISYILDEETGEWKEIKLKPTTLDENNTFFDDDASKKGICSVGHEDLVGYKGFIRIPLSNFRVSKGGTSLRFLDNMIDDGFTVKQVKLSMWDYSGQNAGTTVTVDSMGFSYDPACTTRKNADVQAKILSDNAALKTLLSEDYAELVNNNQMPNMDEYFGVKTNDSVEVEKMIAEIDPYVGKDQFIADCNAVVEAYNKLSPYQQALEEVDYAYNTLFYNKYYDLYVDYDNLIAQEPWVAKYATASELLTDLNALDSKATGFDITSDDNALVKPYDIDTGAINYTDLGIVDKADAERIVEMYEKGYMRLSGAEKGNVSADDLAKLENAYDAAKRLLLLEDYVADINSFKNEIIQIYTAGTAEPDVRMVSYANPDLLEAIDHYEDMSVFAKKMISETADPANANYANMYAAAEAIYDNSHTITMSNGVAIDGGVLVFEDRMLTCAADVEGKINARTVLDTTILNEIEYCLGQTESFLQRYAQIDEINVAYHELADLLPVADVATTTTQALLTNADGGNSYTTDVDLTYVAARLNRNVSVYVVSDHKWTQTTGSTYDFGYFTVNGVTGTDGTTIYTKLDDYANGATAEINPVISVDETAAKKVPTGAVYNGTVTVVAFDSALITDGVDLSTLTPLAEVEIPVVFNSTNGSDPMVYEVQIPATVVVDWDDSLDKDVSYSVKATLGSNELSVNVSNDGTDVLINDDTGTTYELTYSKANFGTETFTGDVAEGTKPANAPSIKITGWDSVPVGAYSTQLTYTVDVTS